MMPPADRIYKDPGQGAKKETIQYKNMLRYMTDRARPGLVASYNIRPGNEVGKFLQPRSPHRADDQKLKDEKPKAELVHL